MDDFETSKEVKIEDPIEETKEKSFNPMDLLGNPVIGELIRSSKGLFEKEKSNPDTCEITIKAPSEVVLKLFRVSE